MTRLTTLTVFLCTLNGFTRAAETLLETGTFPGDVNVEIVDADGSTWVRMVGEPIVEVRENRFLRLRSSPANDHWLGTSNNPMDLGWDYHDKKAKGLRNTHREATVSATGFSLTLLGDKPQAPGVYQRNVLEAVWNPDYSGFDYTLTSTLHGSLKSWRSVSGWAQQGRAQPLDFHIERMSRLDRVFNDNPNGNLYHGLIYPSATGESLWLPKLGVPRTMLKGDYFYDFHLAAGQSFLLPDPDEGGWSVRIEKATGKPRIEVCWSWYDLHHVMTGAIPLQSENGQFESTYQLRFARVSADVCRERLAAATELPWREHPTYQLPVFEPINRFDRQFGGTDWTDPWFRSSEECIWDREVGYDTHGGSLRISRTTSGGGAAWYGVFVGRPHRFEDIAGKRCRVSARVKTRDCTGAVTIGVGQTFTWSTIYGVNISGVKPTSTWIHSERLSGNNDWTELSFEYIAKEKGADTWFFDLKGTGTAWCDNFTISVLP